MTIEELSKLWDEELRVRCAEACGWRRHPNSGFRDGSGLQWKCPDTSRWLRHLSVSTELPDFPADLNAMHEAEKMLSGPEWLGYMSFLEPMAEDNGPGFMIHATARQRCIAFILTKQQS